MTSSEAPMTRTTPSRPVDVEALFPEVAAYRREATRLHPRQGEPGIRDSSVGGPLLWPAHEPWPHCLDAHPKIGFDPQPLGPVPLVPVLQLYAADVPDLPFPPGTDLLQLLWCPYDHGPLRPPVGAPLACRRHKRSAACSPAAPDGCSGQPHACTVPSAPRAGRRIPAVGHSGGARGGAEGADRPGERGERLVVLVPPIGSSRNKGGRLSGLDAGAQLAPLRGVRQTHGPSAHGRQRGIRRRERACVAAGRRQTGRRDDFRSALRAATCGPERTGPDDRRHGRRIRLHLPALPWPAVRLSVRLLLEVRPAVEFGPPCATKRLPDYQFSAGAASLLPHRN